jgi:hypothetical protein
METKLVSGPKPPFGIKPVRTLLGARREVFGSFLSEEANAAGGSNRETTESANDHGTAGASLDSAQAGTATDANRAQGP